MTRQSAVARQSDSTRIAKHSLVIRGHRTSVSLEEIFWRALKDIAVEQGKSLAALVGEIDEARGAANLSSSIRVFVVEQVTARALRDQSATR